MKVTVTPRRLKYASGIAAIVGIGLGGLYLFYAVAITGLVAVRDGTVGLTVGFGVVAGMLSFFAPCSLAIFPSYMSYYASSEQTSSTLRGSVRLGLLATAGMAVAYTIVAISISGVASVLPLSVILAYMIPVLAVLILLLGVAFAAGKTTSGESSNNFAQEIINRAEGANSPTTTIFGFGFAYAVGSITCILPIFIVFILIPFLTGSALTGFIAFLSFIFGKGILMVIATVLTGRSKQRLLTDLGDHFGLVRKIGGGLVIFASFYLFRYGLLLWGVENPALQQIFFL